MAGAKSNAKLLAWLGIQSLCEEKSMNELQAKILDILKWTDALCRAHQIRYYLMGGSMLGAVRHKGFVPWDDDLDIFITHDNYEKIRVCFQVDGDKEHFYLQEYGRRKNEMVTVPKLRMNGTLYEEELTKNWDIHKGMLEETKALPFETVELKVCKGNHEFLTQCFGNYMVPPDEKSIRKAQHAEKWSAETGSDGKGTYSDECKLV